MPIISPTEHQQKKTFNKKLIQLEFVLHFIGRFGICQKCSMPFRIPTKFMSCQTIANKIFKTMQIPQKSGEYKKH